MAEVILLGTGTGVPSLKRGSPGLLLISERSKVLIDSGSGTLRRILEAGVDFLDLDLLLYTHLHPDHVTDLVPILFANKYSDQPRRKDLRCAGGPGFKNYFNQLKRVYGSWLESETYALSIDEWPESPFQFKELTLSSKPMAHLPGSLGYRIELRNGKTIALSGDTDYCRNIVDLASGADLLILECSFPDGRKVEGHLTPSLAGRIAWESRCKRLLLIHLYPLCDQYNILKQCQETFPGESMIGEDLMRIVV